MEQTFGAFIRQKRLAKMIKLNTFASQIGISNVYLSYIETGKRPAPSNPIIEKIKQALNLNENETAKYPRPIGRPSFTPFENLMRPNIEIL